MEPDDLEGLATSDLVDLATATSAGARLHKIRRLRGGRTSLVFLAESEECRQRYVVKVAGSNRTTPLFDNRPDHEWNVLCALSPLGLSPMPVSIGVTEAGLNVLIYQYERGVEGAHTATDLAQLLRRIHLTRPALSLPVCATSSSALIAQAESFVENDLPSWALKLKPVGISETTLDQLCFVHRDPIASNILAPPAGDLLLIDWQCPAFGDPIEDIAHATSPAMAHVYGADPPACPAAVLDAYGDATLIKRARQMLPVYRWRMMCYCNWHIARGNQVYAFGMEREAEALERLNSQRN